MIKIHFVCHGNICRSTMAEFVMKDLVKRQGLEDWILVESAATSREEIGNDIHPGTKRKLTQMGVPWNSRKARQMTKQDYVDFTYLIGMDHYNIRNMERICGGDALHKIHLLLEYAGEDADIADPWYTGDFDVTYRDVLRGCTGLLKKITAEDGKIGKKN